MQVIFPEHLEKLHKEIRPYMYDENAPQEIKDKIEYWRREASKIYDEAHQYFLELRIEKE